MRGWRFGWGLGGREVDAASAGRDGGRGSVAVSDIAPMVITARSAYGSSCRALCFLLENMHGIINAQLILLIAAFQKVRRATQHPLFSNDNGDDDDKGYPPHHRHQHQIIA